MADCPLRGKTVAITEGRRATELATLITKLGGVAYSAPAVREVPRRDLTPALDALDRVCRGEVAAIAFLTGVGARALLKLADDRGRRDDLLRALAGMLVAARGPKPVAALRDAGVRIDVRPAEPTSDALADALASHDLAGKVVAIQLYGDESPALIARLRELGAEPLEIPLYEWALPEDQEPLVRLIGALGDGAIDVIAFTSSPQVRHLFVVAERLGLSADLARVLRERVTVATIGPVCETTLAEHDVTPTIRATTGTMGALVHAIASHLADPVSRSATAAPARSERGELEEPFRAPGRGGSPRSATGSPGRSERGGG